LLQALGEDVGQWTAHAVRNFLLQRASQCGARPRDPRCRWEISGSCRISSSGASS
jgi:hypothetical protein